MRIVISFNFYSVLRNWLIVWLLFLLIGCSTENEFYLEIKEPVLLKCKSGEMRTLELSSPLHKSMVDWFYKNRRGWRESPASYVPGVMIIGKDFTINVLDEMIVVNSKSSQYVKIIASDSFYHKLCK